MKKKPVSVSEAGKNRIRLEISSITGEYASNARLLGYFAQNNPRNAEAGDLLLLETALLRRQEMLIGQLAEIPAKTLDDLRVKLEMCAEEFADEIVTCFDTRIIFSVLEDVRRLSA